VIVVLDTSVVVNAAVRRFTDPDNFVLRAARGEFTSATSSVLLAELRQALSFDRLQLRLAWSNEELDEFMSSFAEASIAFEPQFELAVVRDAKDNRVVEAAVEAEAELIVTTDKDLLDLGEYEGIRMVTPAAFLAILRTERL
jgi:putative PIN family toxin of toxin-antitoxin system